MSSPLVRGTRLSDEAVRRIVRGFAYGEPLVAMAAATGTTKKAVLSLVLALRSRLKAKPFYRWHSPGVFFTTQIVPYEDIVAKSPFTN